MLILVYFKQPPTHLWHGRLVGMRQSKATPWMHVLLPVWRTARRTVGDAPCRTLAALRVQPGVADPTPDRGRLACSRRASRSPPCCHEGTERPLPRPQDTTQQKTCSRGKNKRHRLKNLLLVNQAWRLLVLSETPPGSVHDQRIADTTPYPLPAGSQRLQDGGFQALTVDGVEIIEPTKKPRGHTWTRAPKARHRNIARRRVRIAHVNSRVKRCRTLQETLRRWKAGGRDMVREIGCALHNLRVRLTPSWTPMVSIVMISTKDGSDTGSFLCSLTVELVA